jgi:sigma-E factor negative regulatory protein RseA
MVMHRMSAFMDGESNPTETRAALSQLKSDAGFREAWDAFQLTGDVMRGEPVLSADFMARFQERMSEEPTVLAPRFVWRRAASIALSAAASLAAIGVVGALVFTNNPLTSQRVSISPIARSTPASGAEPQPVAAANRSRVNQYLMAHEEFSPSVMLQGIAPYVRSVSDSRDAEDQ